MLRVTSPSENRDQGAADVTPGEPHPFDLGAALLKGRWSCSFVAPDIPIST